MPRCNDLLVKNFVCRRFTHPSLSFNGISEGVFLTLGYEIQSQKSSLPELSHDENRIILRLFVLI